MKLLKNWNWMRAIRLALGIIIVAQGIQTHDWIFIIVGGLFSLLSLFNIGCCAGGSCYMPSKKHQAGKPADIPYEEVQ